MVKVRQRAFAVLTALLLTTVAPLRATANDDLVVFAAASLTGALDRVVALWASETGNRAVISYAGSSALARQIQAGAGADVFISASIEWMDAIEASGDLRAETRRDLLGNTLVLIAHGREAAPVLIDENLDLAGMLGDERLAMALVDAVPAGVYGRAALTTLGLWDSVEPLIAQADNVRAALAFVAQNEAPFGIVYATDAVVEDDVSIVGTFPAGSHPPISYPVGVTTQSSHPQANGFIAYLGSDAARRIWTEYGFSVHD